MSPSTRQYQSRIRRRPCDRCRRQKLRCQTDSGKTVCQRCEPLSAACVFSANKPGHRLSATSHETTQDGSSINLEIQSLEDPLPAVTVEPSIPAVEDQWVNVSASMPPLFADQSLATQISKSLDKDDDHSYQLFGISSEADPWLLRHCKYDHHGTRQFMSMHFRNAGGVPTIDKVPSHFLISDSAIYHAARDETRVTGHGEDPRVELMSHVPPQYGVRLLRLFMDHVFPTLPILSRTDMGLDQGDNIPGMSILEKTPTHLLAAIYGSALPFAYKEDHLSMFILFEKPVVAKIWKIVYRLILEEIHTPRLSVMQAALLYLHKPMQDNQSYAVPDTPFTWSFMGSVVGLAHSLGLQLECGMMGLPAWEKRLRKRLWWALYIEDKFLSLMLGKPPYLRSSEWDVTDLNDDDFVITTQPVLPVANSKLPFRDMAHLAAIAEVVQEKLYSLRASQGLAHEMALSVETARPIFRSLTAWRESLPLASGTGHSLHDTIPGAPSPYPATVCSAYLVLVACVWRALLRTTVRSSEPAQIIHVEDPADATVSFMNDLRWEFHHLPEMDFRLDHGHRENSTMVGELYEASLGCADTLVDFASNLAAPSFAEFWHSWSRISFALVSNFLMLLLVQAPDFGKAVDAKRLLTKWRRVLDLQHRAFPYFLLAKARLGSYFYVGLEEAFYLPPHVHQALQQGQ